MEHLKMHTPNMADENYRKLAEMFPNAVTETITGYDENGKAIIERAIDADVLRQEISSAVVEGPQERYQFTWPDKRKSVVLANQPTDNTLRLNRAKSVGRDGTPGSIDTENIYIEGDNLDALKLLHETYLGKVKMIYIDPPYNTGSDFIYEDDFSQDTDEYLGNSGQFDEEGSRLVQNLESNGRFHTDWLNMLYPRLRIARDFLSDDGVIFISIDDHEVDNLRKICDEVFGVGNFIAKVSIVTGANQSGDGVLIQKNVEYCLCYAKNIFSTILYRVDKTEESYRNLNDAPTPFVTRLDMGYTIYYNPSTDDMIPLFDYDKSKVYTNDPSQVYSDDTSLINQGYIPVRPGLRNGKLHRWRWGIETFIERKSEIRIFENNGNYTPKFLQSGFNAPKNIWNYSFGTIELKKLFDGVTVFDYTKGLNLLKYICSIGTSNDDIILDFFSGSATTAHAVMQLNAEDGGNRKFIMVQLLEQCDEKSEAQKAGYSTICDIGEERIRRAGRKIREESPLTTGDLDIGFRVFRVDSSNMTDVYYRAQDYTQEQMDLFAENIKSDRTPEDLLFQVMLDLGIQLSSEIEETEIDGKKVFIVGGKYEDLDGIIRTHLVACFDSNVTDNTVTEIAKLHPSYAVFRDSGMANDSVMTNFEQIFESYSPSTERRVL